MSNFRLGTKLVNREVPIFGLYREIFFMGKIDELRMDAETREITLEEYKTRSSPRPPGKAQRATHNLQVMLYKRFFDDIVSGNESVREVTICQKLCLDAEREFGQDLRRHLKDSGEKSTRLRELFSRLREAAENVPGISKLAIDYANQEDGKSFANEAVAYNMDWLEASMKRFLPYWTGERPPVGVEIEEAWKCERCDYADGCEWRMKKSRELLLTKQQKAAAD